MSKSIAKAYTAEKTDELYTPKILVECLKEPFYEWSHRYEHTGQYLLKNNYYWINNLVGIPTEAKKEITVWCPFDTEKSEFVFFFKENFPHVKIVYSHIDNGQDFFEYEPIHWDIAISNPPFSRKLDVFKRLNSFGKPWAMIMNTMALNYQEIGSYFADNPVQLLIPDKRISFDGNPSSFNSCFVCKDFLLSDLQFVHSENNNANQYYKPSRMYK